jgi:GTP-binding protein EngB required for normal cell division
MLDLEPAARALVDLYRTEVRAFLEDHKSTTLEGLDQAAVLLEAALARDPRIDVGFLGESQVGKSSLINAVLGQKALPSGGVGPLTAQATRITHSRANRIEVTYHPRARLNQLIFALERYLERRNELPKTTGPTAPDPEALALAQDVEATARDESPAAVSEMGEYMLSQARLMLCKGGPGEDSSRVALLDGVRASLGLPPRGPEADIEPLRPRIAEIQQKLGTLAQFLESDDGKKEFRAQLHLHAAGWASPLVASLRLGLDSPMLDQMNLVDLPGVGVLGDPAAKVAEEFVKNEADAIVIVMPNNGLTETVTNVLERTNVITRLLFGAPGGVPPIHVSVVVTQLDKVARTHFEEQQEARDEDHPPPDRHAIFAELAGKMCQQVRRNIADALRRSPDFEGLPEETRAHREATIVQLSETMDVGCLSAPDYLSLATGHDDNAFLKRQEATGVPEFKTALLRLRDEAITRCVVGIRESTAHFQAMLFEQLDAIRHRYEDDSGAGGTDLDQFREQLVAAAQPLREEMQGSHGELLGVLREVIPERLGRLCDKAEKVGERRLQSLQKHAGSLHYRSLRAALTRNGTWQKQGIDYPEVLSRAVVDVIAADWNDLIVGQVRQTVQKIVARDLVLVERLCEVARRHDERIVAEAQIDARTRILQQEAHTCVSWTEDHLDRLRKNVETKLKGAVEKPIEAACRRAANAGDDVGSGARERILEAFDDGGRAALAQAGKVAEKTLREHYDGLLRELMQGYLARQHDPLGATLEALTDNEIVRARQAGVQHRRRVIDDVSALRGRVTDLDVA